MAFTANFLIKINAIQYDFNELGRYIGVICILKSSLEVKLSERLKWGSLLPRSVNVITQT